MKSALIKIKVVNGWSFETGVSEKFAKKLRDMVMIHVAELENTKHAR